MNKILLLLAVTGAFAPSVVRAQEAPIVVDDVPLAAMAQASPMASVSVFIAGLKEPQGLELAWDNYGSGEIIVCDYGAGEVLRFDKAGAKKEVLASGLKGPSQIVRVANQFVVSERKANRVVRLSGGKAIQVGGEIVEPMGLLPDNRISLLSGVKPPEPAPFRLSNSDWEGVYAVAHTTSKIYRLDKTEWKLVYAAPDEDGDVGRYGLRCLADDRGAMFLSDEVNGEVLMVTRSGRIAKFASGFADPSGLAVRGDWVYVCDEGEGGRLWKVDRNGVKTLVAQGLGRPRNVLFLDDATALVSDRDGRVLKLSWAG